jgi:hypothetical protein
MDRGLPVSGPRQYGETTRAVHATTTGYLAFALLIAGYLVYFAIED